MRLWCGRVGCGALRREGAATVHWWSRVRCAAARCSDAGTDAHTEVIPADAIVIEEMNVVDTMHRRGFDATMILSCTTTQPTPSTTTSPGVVEGSTLLRRPESHTRGEQAYVDVTHIDPFARSRVVNFLRRTGHRDPTLFHSRRSVLRDGRAVYVATCRLTLPAPHHLYVAEGVAESAKDAELLAAMHAERVCDALGVPLFQLASMQRKHALAARQQGRPAPMPGDPMQLDNRNVPAPLRMMSSQPDSSNAAGSGASTASFATRIAEAELVTSASPVTHKAAVHAVTPREKVLDRAAPEPPPCDNVAGVPYASTVWYPWSVPVNAAAGSGAHGGSDNAAKDATEQGTWQMVNCVSMRCSPTPHDALVLPCVYEPAAYDRIQDYFLQHRTELATRVRFAHVLGVGCATRMYLAELSLVEAGVVARGKASTKDIALRLAAMHAELLLDALGKPLFPRDPSRQARHAVAVARYGRWAPHPEHPTLPSPSPPLPLPLKQLVVEETTRADDAFGHYRRSEAERMVMAHNALNGLCFDMLEINPPPEMLQEARARLATWQRVIARNPSPELYILTKMGELYRAVTITPVPRVHGLRGGVALGTSLEQAMGLCALHALDGLCALHIPVCENAADQARFLALRRALNMVTGDLVPAASLHDSTSETGAAVRVGPTRVPYLPGYRIDRSGPMRLLPSAAHTCQVLALRAPQAFHRCTEITREGAKTTRSVSSGEVGETVFVQLGNWVKTCVQNYLRVMSSSTAEHVDDNGTESVAQEAVQLRRRHTPIPPVAAVCMTEGTLMLTRNIAFLPIPMPPSYNPSVPRPVQFAETDMDGPLASLVRTQCGEREVLAVGMAPKRKDADRLCFLHAAALLYAMNEDVLQNHRAGLPRQCNLNSFDFVRTTLKLEADTEAWPRPLVHPDTKFASETPGASSNPKRS